MMKQKWMVQKQGCEITEDEAWKPKEWNPKKHDWGICLPCKACLPDRKRPIHIEEKKWMLCIPSMDLITRGWEACL